MLISTICVLVLIVCGVLGIVFSFITIIYIKKEGGKKSAVYGALGVLFCAIFSFLVYIRDLRSSSSFSNATNICFSSINKNILNNIEKKNNRTNRKVNHIKMTGDDNIITAKDTNSNMNIGTDKFNKTFLQNLMSDDYKEQEKVNEIIEKLSLSMNKKYIEELLGTPIYTFTENGLINNFYVLKSENVVIRCIFKEDESMAGYLVTVNKITEKNDEAIQFSNPMNGGMELKYGYSTIDEIESEDYKGKIIANYGNGGEYNYYWQYYQVLYKNCGFIVAILPYGFYENSTDMLMELVDAQVNNNKKKLMAYEADGGHVDEAISIFKKYVHPNTYGIINMDYAEYINPCIEDDSWKECVEDLLKNEIK